MSGRPANPAHEGEMRLPGPHLACKSERLEPVPESFDVPSAALGHGFRYRYHDPRPGPVLGALEAQFNSRPGTLAANLDQFGQSRTRNHAEESQGHVQVAARDWLALDTDDRRPRGRHEALAQTLAWPEREEEPQLPASSVAGIAHGAPGRPSSAAAAA